MKNIKLKKAVVYARKSPSNSVESQLDACRLYELENDYFIIREYVDEKNERKAFIKMIKDSKKREFDFVIVSSIDRFVRNKYESAIYKSILNKNGVKVVSTTQKDATGIFINSVLEATAEYYASVNEEKEYVKNRTYTHR